MGRWRDNVFVERLWRSPKYDEVYLYAYETVADAQQGVGRYLTFYNQLRPHRALDGRTHARSRVLGAPACTAHGRVGSHHQAPFMKWQRLSKLAEPPLWGDYTT